MCTANEPTASLRSRLVVPRGGALVPVVVETLNAVDRVHHVPASLPRVRVTWAGEEARRGRYIPASEEQTAQIELLESGRTPRLTFAHEIGHLLDHWLGGLSDYASAAPGASLAGVLAAAKQTTAFSQLRREGEDQNKPLFVRRSITTYLMSNEEIWPRAYSQYIATRSGSSALQSEVSRVRGQNDYEAHTLWSDDDFAAVAGQIDALLRRLGWQR